MATLLREKRKALDLLLQRIEQESILALVVLPNPPSLGLLRAHLESQPGWTVRRAGADYQNGGKLRVMLATGDARSNALLCDGREFNHALLLSPVPRRVQEAIEGSLFLRQGETEVV